MPDISFIEAYKDDLVGILITHAHEDHYGAIYDLWPRLGAPVYMTPFAAALHAAKREMEPNAPRVPTSVVEQGTALLHRSLRSRTDCHVAFAARNRRQC